MVLTYFVLGQFDRVNPNSYHYLVSNFVGSLTLTITAVLAHEWGFVLLEGVWALVSAYGLLRRLRGRAPLAAH